MTCRRDLVGWDRCGTGLSRRKAWERDNNTALEAAVDKILAANPETVQSYLNGKEASHGWLVGQVMKETRGQANASRWSTRSCAPGWRR